MAALQSENDLNDVSSRRTAAVNLLPPATGTGAIVYLRDGTWVTLEPPERSAPHTLTIADGVLAWVPIP